MNLSKILHYDLWANQELLSVLVATDAPVRAWQIMAHIVAVHQLFLARVGHGQVGPVWPDPKSFDIATKLLQCVENWQFILEEQELPLDSLHSYVNSKNEPWTSSLEDIVVHVVMHGSYHRGQIALLLGNSKLEPPYTDFIHATRNKLVE